jgi:HAD superfamily hydrolase (TIGR01509 family)
VGPAERNGNEPGGSGLETVPTARPDVDLVVFDLDGVLVDTQYAEDAGIRYLALLMDVDLSPIQATELFTGKRLGACIALLEKMSGRAAPDDASELVRAECERILGPSLDPIEGVAEVLPHIDTRMCVASNSPRSLIERRLRACGIIDHFEGRLFSAYDVNSWKPEPTLFLSAAADCRVSASLCSVIEDSPVGVRAGVSAGMRVLQFTNGRPCTAHSHGVTTFAHMSQLPALI